MKGVNTFVLNHETVVEALQEYFDKRLDPNVDITAVKVGGSYVTDFEVLVKASGGEA